MMFRKEALAFALASLSESKIRCIRGVTDSYNSPKVGSGEIVRTELADEFLVSGGVGKIV